MARKSRKNFRQKVVSNVFPSSSKSKTAIYGRLSVEDNHYVEGDSLENQVSYLKEFVRKHREELELVDVYLDNGATGTNFDRYGWQTMISDIKSGKIDCLLVKDFSRIGRNYIEVGNYLEKIFPFMNVRVISVNDGFDSKKQSFDNNFLINSLTNIVNEYYARDISQKVLQANKAIRCNGEYASGIFPYGYKRADENKRKMMVDPETASVVKKIYEWRICGNSCSRIADYLNELVIPSPGLYRFMDGEQTYKKCINSKWKSENVSSILSNPVYLGHTVQGKTKCSHFQNNGKKERVPKEGWIITENTHEPIVTREQYDISENMAAKSKEKYLQRIKANSEIPIVENPLRRKIFCGQCGARMFRRSKVENGKRNYYFYCDAKRRKVNASCSQSYVRESQLMQCIKDVTEKHLQLLEELKQEKAPQDEFEKRHLKEDRLWKLKQQLDIIRSKKKELYEDMKSGMLNQKDYKYECETLSKKQEQCKQEIERLMNEEQVDVEVKEVSASFSDQVIRPLEKDIDIDQLDALIEKITLYPQGRIEILYSYSDIIAGKAGCGQ